MIDRGQIQMFNLKNNMKKIGLGLVVGGSALALFSIGGLHNNNSASAMRLSPYQKGTLIYWHELNGDPTINQIPKRDLSYSNPSPKADEVPDEVSSSLKKNVHKYKEFKKHQVMNRTNKKRRINRRNKLKVKKNKKYKKHSRVEKKHKKNSQRFRKHYRHLRKHSYRKYRH